VAGDVVSHGPTLRFAGGADNVPALEEALRAGDGEAAILWLHGPQPVDLDDPATVKSRLDEPNCPDLFDVQLHPGPDRIVERLDGARHLIRYVGTVDDLRARLEGRQKPYRFVSGVSQHSPDVSVRNQIYTLLHSSPAAAHQLAMQHHLVTPASSAAVLDVPLQEGIAEATQANLPTAAIGTSPEPESWTLGCVAVVLLWARRKRHVEKV
jgi:hypothetical protein